MILNSTEAIIDEILKKVMIMCCEVVLVHPEDAMNFDMKDVPENVYFVSYPMATPGQVLLIKDKEVKKSLLDFCRANPERCWKGEKEL